MFRYFAIKKNENEKTYTKPLSRMMNPVLFHRPQVSFPSIVVDLPDHSVHEIGYIKQMYILKSIKNFIV